MKNCILNAALLLPLALLNMIYPVLNRADRPVHTLITDIDRGIPFIEAFIIPYIGWYFFVVFTIFYFALKDKETYYKVLLSLYLGMIFCYGVYFFYQTTVPRPELLEHDILNRMVRQLYVLDQPFNCFPSIHALGSYLMFKGIRRSGIRTWQNQLIIAGTAFVIIMSTLFIKQHVILDAFAAIILGETMFILSDRLFEMLRKRVMIGSTAAMKLDLE